MIDDELVRAEIGYAGAAALLCALLRRPLPPVAWARHGGWVVRRRLGSCAGQGIEGKVAVGGARVVGCGASGARSGGRVSGLSGICRQTRRSSFSVARWRARGDERGRAGSLWRRSRQTPFVAETALKPPPPAVDHAALAQPRRRPLRRHERSGAPSPRCPGRAGSPSAGGPTRERCRGGQRPRRLGVAPDPRGPKVGAMPTWDDVVAARHPPSGCRGHDGHSTPALKVAGGSVPAAHRPRRPRAARRRPRRARGPAAGPARRLLHHAPLRRRTPRCSSASSSSTPASWPSSSRRRWRLRAPKRLVAAARRRGLRKLAAGAAVPRPPRFVTRRPAPRGRRAWPPGAPAAPRRRRRPRRRG